MSDAPANAKAPKQQGWIRRLIGYMAPHKKNAYIAFGVAIGGQLIQSLLPVVQKVVVDDVITRHDKPLTPWLTLMILMGVSRSRSRTCAGSTAAASRSTCSTTCAPRSSGSSSASTSRATTSSRPASS
jgi:hypothetical protein